MADYIKHRRVWKLTEHEINMLFGEHHTFDLGKLKLLFSRTCPQVKMVTLQSLKIIINLSIEKSKNSKDNV